MRRLLLVVVLFTGVLVASPMSPTNPVEAFTCTESGEGCFVGARGPRGGIIFYDAGTQQWWGRYLEAETTATRVAGVWGAAQSIYGASASQAIQRQSMAIGMGKTNSNQMRAAGATLALTALAADQDWHIPSKDELDMLYNFWRVFQPAGVDYGQVPVWTSSESEDTFAWYQLFHDGTQFTDANGIIGGLKSNKQYTKSARHSGSDFAPADMHLIRVRAFPATGAQPPAPSLVTAPASNPSCVNEARGCRVGDVGPGGGIVVYDAGSAQPWGRYLEIAPKSCEITRVAYSPRSTTPLFPTASDRVRSKFIGQGKANTQKIAGFASSGSAAAAAQSSSCGGFSDWFLPSKDELNEAFRWLSHSRRGLQLTPVGGFERGYYWTSSDYNGSTAWSQYFADGQQFDRVQTLTGNKMPPARPFSVRPMRAFFEGGVSTPTIAIDKSIVITGSRTTVNGKTGIQVEGIATGFAAGAILRPWSRFPGEVSHTQGSAQITVGADGSFTWTRKTGKRITVYVESSDGVKSNRVTISSQ
jgi:hypothetical protein